MLFGFFVSINHLQSALDVFICHLSNRQENKFQSFWIDLFDKHLILCQLFVARQKRLDCIDANRNEFFPKDFAIWIFVSNREQHSHVVDCKLVRQ